MRAGDALWTDDRIALLEQMRASGASAAAIAKRLGVSRSAVLGKIFRLRRPSAKKQQAAAQASLKSAAPKRHRADPPRRRGISLLELTNDTCRWPHGEPGRPGFFFCGEPGADLESGRPYCARHARRAYSRAANLTEEDSSPVIAVRDSPPTVPLHARRSYVWRALVKYPASRGK